MNDRYTLQHQATMNTKYALSAALEVITLATHTASVIGGSGGSLSTPQLRRLSTVMNSLQEGLEVITAAQTALAHYVDPHAYGLCDDHCPECRAEQAEVLEAVSE